MNNSDGATKGDYEGIGHGECCAGIIAASHNNIGIAGIAPNIKIVPFRIFKSSGYSFRIGAIAKTITKSWQEFDADILSCSWSVTSQSDKLDKAIKDCMTKGRNNKGAIVVFSSGNSSSQVEYPANNTGVITVGAIDKNGIRYNYSCYNATLELVAPSGSQPGNIRTLDLEGENGYTSTAYYDGFGGTSAACPQVAGVAALMLSVNPNLTKAQVMSILNQTATKLSNYTFETHYLHPDGTWNEQVGYGLVNATKAVAEATMYGLNYEIVGETSLNVCEHYTYSLTGAIPYGCRIEWNASFHFAIISQSSNSIILNPLVQTNDAQIVASIYLGNTLIKQIIKDNIIINNSIPYYQNISQKDTIYSENTQWDENSTLGVKVYINSGTTLTINNTTIHCTQDAKIIVKQGGKLILNNATLTNICDGELWQGIEVHGNPLLSQDLNNTNQGILILQNEAIIENAECGVYVGEKRFVLVSFNGGITLPILEGFEEPISMSSGGGIVSATNSSFINNKKAINFQNYIYMSNNMEIDNKSSFTNCSFIVNDNALFTVSNNESQVSLQYVKGVRFNGCNFIDAQPKSSLDNYGIGIYSYNAGICLNDNRSPFNLIPYEAIPCSFSGYGTAIQIKYSGTRPTRIYNTLFINNQTSINAVSAYALTMQMCDVHNTLYNHHFPSLYGLVLNKCDNYSVANNIFHGEGTGILFLGEETNNNYIKNNTFHDMCVACYVDGVQGLYNFHIPSIGLKFSCNLFNNNEEDIKVAENGIIGTYQGYYSNYKYYGTGNQFGNPDISTMNIDNCNNSFEIWYYYDLNGYNHNPVNCNNINPPNPNIVINSVLGNKCLASGYIGENYYLTTPIVPISELNDMYLNVINEYNILKAEYINMYGSINIVDIVNSQGLPDIQGLNPQFDMYAKLTDLKDSLTIICQNALQFLLTNEELNKSEYNTWLYRCETIDADYVLAESYLNEGNITQMNTILDDIPNKYPNCDLAENEQYKICLNYLYQWDNTNIDSLIITQESIDSLELIASGSNRASLKAEAMLRKLGKFIMPYWEPDRCDWVVVTNPSLENKNETFIKETKIGLIQEMILTPNPATDKLKVDNGQIHIKELYIYDVVGKEVKRFKGNNTKITVSVDDLCSGVYIVKALSENGIAIKKFVKK